MEVQKPEAAVWVEDADDENWVGWTGYGHTILARWEGVTDNKREQQLFMKCDLNCNVKDDTGNLVIIEILKTNDCRFFPILTEEDDNTIARFTVDFSACEDTKELSQDSLLTSRLARTPKSLSSLSRTLLLKDARSLTPVV